MRMMLFRRALIGVTGVIFILAISRHVVAREVAPNSWALYLPSQVSRQSTLSLLLRAEATGELDTPTTDLYLALALTNDPRLPPAYVGQGTWRGTLALLRIRRHLSTATTPPGLVRSGTATSQAMYTEIASILSTDQCDNKSENLTSVLDTDHFHIEYSPALVSNGLTISDFAKWLEIAWNTEIGTFGWAAPPIKSNAPSHKYPVRVSPLSGGLLGVTTDVGTYAGFIGDNPNTPWNDVGAEASCMVINSTIGLYRNASNILAATAAHEFAHSVQFGMNSFPTQNGEDMFVESTAVLTEDEVVDGSNDGISYLWPDLKTCMALFTSNSTTDFFPYEYWIVFRAMTERYGHAVAGGIEQWIQDVFETASIQGNWTLDTFNTAFARRGTTLGQAFHEAAISMKFDKQCSATYRQPYCFIEGASYAAATANGQTINPAIAYDAVLTTPASIAAGSIADNYTAAWILLPGVAASLHVTVENISSGGEFRSSLACDTGETMVIVPLTVANPNNSQSSRVSLPGQAQSGAFPVGSSCKQLALVITNQAQTAAAPISCPLESFRVRMSTTPIVLDKHIRLPFVKN